MPKTQKKKQTKIPAENTDFSATAGKGKQAVFKGLLVLLPIVFILLLEGTLRIFGYGPNLNIFITHENKSEYWITNPNVGRRYFFVKDVAPATSYDVILKDKPENCYRIFVLGGSTTAGFPYYHNGAFPRMLQTRLESVFPNHKIEVLNLGMPAVNSYTLLDLTDELMDFKPDALLIYAGHNEFYGALGIASTEALGKYREFVNIYLKLQHLKIFYLLKDFIGWTKSLLSNGVNPNNQSATLMERMVGNKTIEYGSEDYQTAKNIFKENLSEIASIVEKNNVPIIISNLVSNIKTHKPFESLEPDKSIKTKWDKLYQTGLNHAKEKSFELALESFEQASKLYAQSALLEYTIAKTLEAMEMPSQAKAHFYKAKDLDALRFRATEDFNEEIESVADADKNIYFLDMKLYFEVASPDSLIGSNLMLEHLHPNLQGYALMAKAFFVSMQEHGFVESEWDTTKILTDEAYWTENAVSPLDVSVANERVQMLLSGWPFKKSSVRPTPRTPENKMEEFSANLLADKTTWEKAHVGLAEYYASQKDFEKAVLEYKTLIRGTPYNISPYLRLGLIYLELKAFGQALDVFEQSLKVEETAIANKWIGSILVNKGDVRNGISYIERSLQMNAADPEAIFNITVAYAMLGEFASARNYCEKLLKSHPNHPGAKELWKRLSGQ